MENDINNVALWKLMPQCDNLGHVVTMYVTF